MSTKKVAVVAVGGNSLIVDPVKKTLADQYAAAKESMHQIASMIQSGWNVILVHGNGPQVGFVLRRSDLASHELPPVSMDYAVANTQGSIGYMFQKALQNEFRQRGMQKQVLTVVTQVLVDQNDPAFAQPTKPIGSFMDQDVARERAEQKKWTVVEDSGRGWRRVVPSPIPQKIIESTVIQSLVTQGVVVVACGGGGIPVIADTDGNLEGVEAVIDKDYAASLLATSVQAEMLLIATAVEKVALHFKKPQQEWLSQMTITEAEQYIAEGHFAKGSMQPKVQALVSFLKRGGKSGLITTPWKIPQALAHETGTWILPDA